MTKLIDDFLYFSSRSKNGSTQRERELARYKIVTYIRSFSRTEGVTDCDLVVAKVRERLAASKRGAYKFNFRLIESQKYMLEKQSASAHKITRVMVTGVVKIMGTNVDISLSKTRRNPSSQ